MRPGEVTRFVPASEAAGQQRSLVVGASTVLITTPSGLPPLECVGLYAMLAVGGEPEPILVIHPDDARALAADLIRVADEVVAARRRKAGIA